MTPRIVAIRPEPGLASTLEAGRERGLDIAGHSLFEVESVAWEAPVRSEFDALLIGSANVFRHGGDELLECREMPVLAVGQTTAEAAAQAGFRVQQVGQGGLQSLLDSLGDTPRHLLRLAGEEHVPLSSPKPVTMTTRVVYRVSPLPFDENLVQQLSQDAVVMLHSAAAARHFAAQCDKCGIDKSHISLAALGPRILEPVGTGWRDAKASEMPEETALLALAKDMCHEARKSRHGSGAKP